MFVVFRKISAFSLGKVCIFQNLTLTMSRETGSQYKPLNYKHLMKYVVTELNRTKSDFNILPLQFNIK